MDLGIHDKTALVTGSSKGIGEAIARALAREGATVVLHGRSLDALARVQDSIVADGGTAHAVTGDVTDDAEVEAFVTQARALVGRIDIVVNNAGGAGANTDWNSTSAAAWMASYDRNTLAAVRVNTRVLPSMRQAGWGRIIQIASLAGMMPPASRPDYSAAKASMIAATASLAKAVAADGVTVNTVSPGTIHSERLDRHFREEARRLGVADAADWETVEAAALASFAAVPAGRVGTLEEIADTVAFLASARAGYITGSNIRVDGGMLPTA